MKVLHVTGILVRFQALQWSEDLPTKGPDTLITADSEGYSDHSIFERKKVEDQNQVCLTMSLSFLVREYNAFSFK